MGCFECIKMKSQRGGSKINAQHSAGVTRALGGVSTMSKKRNAAKKYGQQTAGSSADTLKSSRETSASSTHSRSQQHQKQQHQKQQRSYDASSISSSLASASSSKVDIKHADGNNNNHGKRQGMMKLIKHNLLFSDILLIQTRCCKTRNLKLYDFSGRQKIFIGLMILTFGRRFVFAFELGYFLGEVLNLIGIF